MAAMASRPPIAPAGNKMRLLPSRAADLSFANSVASASAPTEMTRQSIPPRSTVPTWSATAAWLATSATTVGLRAISSSSASTMSTPSSFARAAALRPGRASAPTMRTPRAASSARRAATTSCAMPPQPIRPIAVMRRSLWVQPHSGELPLRQLFHRVAHAFAPEAARADTAERVGVEPEAAGIVDPERADPKLAGDLECGLEARGEAGALEPEFGRICEFERGIDVADVLHDHHRTKRLFAHEPCLRRRVRHDRGTENGAAALGLEHELAAFGNGVLDHLFNPVGRRAADHRPHVGGSVFGVADLELFGGRDEQFEKPLEYRPLDDDALRRDALLPARLERRAGDARRGIVEVGIGADDIRRVRAEFADEFLGARGSRQFIAGGGAAGDGHDRDKRMGGKELGGLAPAGNNVEKSVGYARRLHRLRHQ